MQLHLMSNEFEDGSGSLTMSKSYQYLKTDKVTEHDFRYLHFDTH